MDPPAPEPPLDRPMEEAERKALVDKALGQLDPEDRALLLMRETEDKSYEEIASILGTALGTVKSRLARSREKLRLLLKDAPL
jgi:RNA polymerase sigma-70 factor (ECF subfamily)